MTTTRAHGRQRLDLGRFPVGQRAGRSTQTEPGQARPPGAEPMRLAADEPITNYAVRVGRSLDDLVAWRLAELRPRGLRTAKV